MKTTVSPGRLRLGFVGTRFATTDGVSLESEKWSTVLEQLGHTCFYFCGYSDRIADRSYVVPEAHFRAPAIVAVYDQAFSHRERPAELTEEIHRLSSHLKESLYSFVRRFEIQVLLVENALAIPLNLPLGLALTEFIAETGMPTVAHHHDLYWERPRFLVNCVWDYLDMCFPPRLPQIRHIVINSPAAGQLSFRRGISAHLIPNVMDFETLAPRPDDYAATLRGDLGLSDPEFLLLQPTRMVKRKGIEHSIELVRRLHLPSRLVISHAGDDEGGDYEKYLREYSDLLSVPTVFAADIISDHRGRTADGRKIYSLWDAYPFADLVTYPSLLEGFGNAFLEAVYFRRPILVNDYTIYAIDIKPKGFRAIELNGFITDRAIAEVEQVLQSPAMVEESAEHNYQLGKRFYSYGFLKRQLEGILASLTGEEPRD